MTSHGTEELAVYPQVAGGYTFNAAVHACKGNRIVNLQEDLAAEQKTRATYFIWITQIRIIVVVIKRNSYILYGSL